MEQDLTDIIVGTSNAAAILEEHDIEPTLESLRDELNDRVSEVVGTAPVDELDEGYRIEFVAEDGPNYVEETSELRALAKAVAWHIVAFPES